MARLVEVATARLTRELHTEFVTALRRTSHVISVAVRVTDSDGVVGYAEAPQIWRVTGESVASIEACVLGPLADALLGREFDDPAADQIHQMLGNAVAGNTGARAACEIAVLDLLARRAGRPLAAAIGAEVDSVGTDITIAAQVSDPFAEKVPDGFGIAKIKVGLDAADVERVIRIQQAAGPQLRIRVDANQAWDVDTALSTVEAWQAAGVNLDVLEQPLPAHDVRGHAVLRNRLSVPIMLDESVFSVHDLHRALDAEAADMVNIKLAKCGGIHAGLEIARVARAAGLGVMVGSMMESELGVAAAAAFAAVVAPTESNDLDAAWWSIAATDDGTPYRGDRFLLSDEPGLSRAAARVADDLGAWQKRRLG